MTIAATIDAIQTAVVAVSGITTAPAHSAYPESVESLDMPVAITWPAGGEAWHKGPGYDIHKSIYEVAVYIKPVEEGAGIFEAWNSVIDLFQLVLDALLDKDINNLVDGTYTSYVTPSADTPLTHGGLEIIAYPPAATGVEGYRHYYGFRVQVPVNEQWSQT